jgi:hypothetical protein
LAASCAAARRLKRDDPVWLKRYAREAAVEAVGDEEHCRDLAGEHARESAWRSGDLISSVRDRYEKVVEELLAVRYVQRDGRRYSLSSVLLRECGSDEATEELLQHLGIWIQRFTLSYYMYKLPTQQLGDARERCAGDQDVAGPFCERSVNGSAGY